MARSDARAYLQDIIVAAENIALLMDSIDLETYVADMKTRLAAERELITLGEAVARLLELAPHLIEDWPVDPRSVIGMRNVLVHGYSSIDELLVFEAATLHTPSVHTEASRALRTLDPQR